MNDHLYVLNEAGEPVVEPDCVVWARWYENKAQRIVKQDTVQENPRIWVSTVFLGIDHNYSETGRPVLWETMVFGGLYDQFQRRYSSKEDALAGHEETILMAMEGAHDR